MGLTPLTLWLACLLAVRSQRILTAWAARQDDNTRRAAVECRQQLLTDLFGGRHVDMLRKCHHSPLARPGCGLLALRHDSSLTRRHQPRQPGPCSRSATGIGWRDNRIDPPTGLPST